MTRLCIISESAPNTITEAIQSLGFEVLKAPAHPHLAGACQSHPDLSFFRIAPNTLIYAKGCDPAFIATLQAKGITMIAGETELQAEYPYDIPYNGIRIGQYLVHNLRYTDTKVKKMCQEENLTALHVRQGYTCCSTAFIREDLIVTADTGIYNALQQTGTVQALLVPPQKKIQLPGMDYGFLGGASGRMDDTHFALAGHVRYLENGKQIQDFLEKNDVQLINLTDQEPLDLGTLMFFTL